MALVVEANRSVDASELLWFQGILKPKLVDWERLVAIVPTINQDFKLLSVTFTLLASLLFKLMFDFIKAPPTASRLVG